MPATGTEEMKRTFINTSMKKRIEESKKEKAVLKITRHKNVYTAGV